MLNPDRKNSYLNHNVESLTGLYSEEHEANEIETVSAVAQDKERF